MTIWLFENSRFFDLSFAGDRLKIYHQVDLNQEFNLKAAASTAGICFCTTDIIRNRLIPYNDRVYKIHHGLAIPREKVPLTGSQQDLFNPGVPHAVYIGNLEMRYLDVELLARVIHEFPGVQFHLVGGYREEGPLRRLVRDAKNVAWWGKVDSALIPAILERADVLLVTYQAAHWQDQASPHKFMEYLASGKTVVATYTDEYKDKRHLLEMVDDNRDYLAVFERVLQNLGEYNSEERRQQRMAFARDNTYDLQLARIDARLRENGLRSILG